MLQIALTLSFSSMNCLYVTNDSLASPGLLAAGLASRSGSDSDEALVESAVCFASKVASTGLVDVLALSDGLASGLTGSCLVCSVCNMGLVAESERGLERGWLTSAKRRAGSGGLAEDSGLVCGVTLEEESWNIDWGLEGCILFATLVCICLTSGPKNDYNCFRLQFLMAVTENYGL